MIEENLQKITETRTGRFKVVARSIVWNLLPRRFRLLLHDIAVLNARVTCLEDAWKQNVPSFLNAVSTVRAFGFELIQAQTTLQRQFEENLERTQTALRQEFSDKLVQIETTLADQAERTETRGGKGD